MTFLPGKLLSQTLRFIVPGGDFLPSNPLHILDNQPVYQFIYIYVGGCDIKVYE